MVIAETCVWEKSISRKNQVSHWEISVFCTTKECDNATVFYYLISALFSVNWALTETLKTKENFQHLAQKVVAAAYERWSLTGGTKYCDLTWKLFLSWKTGRWGEVVTYESWSQPEVRLDCLLTLNSAISLFVRFQSHLIMWMRELIFWRKSALRN